MTAVPHICQSGEYGPHTACGRCNLTWLTEAKQRPSCKPKADPPIAFNETIEFFRDEAQRIFASQRAAIGPPPFRTTPHMGQLRNTAILLNAANIFEALRDTPAAVKLLTKAGG